MPHKRKLKKDWGKWAIQGILAILILAICLDYGKHLVLKHILENEIATSEGLVASDSLAVSPWPLLHSQLIVNNFQVNVSGMPIAAKTVRIRQGWLDWRQAHIHATEIKQDETVTVQETQGMLDTKDIKAQVKVSELILKGIQARLPFFTLSGAHASCDFLYDMASQRLSLKIDAPEISFPNSVTFGLNGKGLIETKAPVHGKMDVKIKNIDKMMKELVATGVIDASQAGLVTAGSDLLGSIGLRDITLPLKIEDGIVSLGPVSLFKVGKPLDSHFSNTLVREKG